MDIDQRMQRLLERRGETQEEFDAMLKTKYPAMFDGVPQTSDGRAAMGAGHGHVFANANGERSRCGGSKICSKCIDDAKLKASITEAAAFIKASSAFTGTDVPNAEQADDFGIEAGDDAGGDMVDKNGHPQSFEGIPETIDPKTLERLEDITLPSQQELMMEIFASTRLQATAIRAISEQDFKSWDSSQQKQWLAEHPESKFRPGTADDNENGPDEGNDEIIPDEDGDEPESLSTEEDDAQMIQDAKDKAAENRKARAEQEKQDREAQRQRDEIKMQKFMGYMKDAAEDIINLGQDPSNLQLEFDDNDQEEPEETGDPELDRAYIALSSIDNQITAVQSKLKEFGEGPGAESLSTELAKLVRYKEKLTDYIVALEK
ncbi:hypothetical protein [Achromobacter phage Motura]|uniref:Uncharacterized protein n=1 Tax=Achromobacter phage Motura TaxID=2591403 RepID=A0A514CT20_9CAUD|nr:hypothetical protein H1O15_gp172 [Achromobacter phage Motura]QDH83616.1 hypothetical protein [Achromobacter phage Motura]